MSGSGVVGSSFVASENSWGLLNVESSLPRYLSTRMLQGLGTNCYFTIAKGLREDASLKECVKYKPNAYSSACCI